MCRIERPWSLDTPALLLEVNLTPLFAAIRSHLQQQRAYGRDAFQAIVEAKTRRFAGVRPAHRPGREARSFGK